MSDLEKRIQQKLSADGKELLPDGAEDRLLAAVSAAHKAEEPPSDSPHSWSYNLAAVASLMAVFALGLLVSDYTPGTISIGPSTGTTEVQTDSVEGSASEEGPSTEPSSNLTSPAERPDSGNEGPNSRGGSNSAGTSTNEDGSVSHANPDTENEGPVSVEEFAPGLLRSPSATTGDSGSAGPAGSGSSDDAEDIPVPEDPEPTDPQEPVEPTE